MKNNRLKGPRVIILIAILIVVVILILGNQSFRATEKASFDEFNQRQLVLSTGAAGGIERLVPLQPVRWLEKPLAMDALLALVWQGLGQQGT